MLSTNNLLDRLPLQVTTAESDVPFTAMCIPGPGSTLSLAPLQEPKDVEKNPELVTTLRDISRSMEADKIYAPTPTKANAEIIEPTALKLSFVLGNGVVMFRNPAKPADGTLLRQPGDACIYSAGGCGFIAATMDDYLVVAHAARESLMDKQRVLTGQSSRHHESVVDAIVDTFRDLGYEQFEIAARLRVWLLYFIKPMEFFHPKADPEHPEHKDYNNKVAPYLAEHLGTGFTEWADGVRLDLPLIAAAQFKKHGVPAKHINLGHSYLADDLPTTRNGGGRYIVAIVRR